MILLFNITTSAGNALIQGSHCVISASLIQGSWRRSRLREWRYRRNFYYTVQNIPQKTPDRSVVYLTSVFSSFFKNTKKYEEPKSRRSPASRRASLTLSALARLSERRAGNIYGIVRTAQKIRRHAKKCVAGLFLCLFLSESDINFPFSV